MCLIVYHKTGHSVYTKHAKRTPTDCVVYGAILHELGAEQYHMKRRSRSVQHVLSMSRAWSNVSHTCGILFITWFLSFLTFKYILNWCFEQAYHMAKRHTTWLAKTHTTWLAKTHTTRSCGMPLIPHETHKML